MTDLDDCYLAALRILNYRFNSSAELKRKLTAKKFDRKLVDETIARLREEKWLDDERFAGAYVRTRMIKKVGPRKIERELQAAGVDRETAAIAVRENNDEERERSTISRALHDAKRKRHAAAAATAPVIWKRPRDETI